MVKLELMQPLLVEGEAQTSAAKVIERILSLFCLALRPPRKSDCDFDSAAENLLQLKKEVGQQSGVTDKSIRKTF